MLNPIPVGIPVLGACWIQPQWILTELGLSSFSQFSSIPWDHGFCVSLAPCPSVSPLAAFPAVFLEQPLAVPTVLLLSLLSWDT